MPDAQLTEASKSILDVGVIGAICLLLIAALIIRERMWRADMKAERDAHQETREEHLADVKHFAMIGESVRDQMKTQVQAFQNVIDLFKTRGGS
jgi:hypothetical protein